MRYGSLASRNFKEVWRDPISLGLGAAMPCCLIALFAYLGRRVPSEVFTASSLAPGLAVFGFTMLIMFSAMLLSKDRSSGLFSRLRATPLGSGDFLLAYSLPFLPFAFVQALACYAAGAALGMPLGWGQFASLAALLPAAASSLGIGLVLGSFLAESQIAGVGSGLVTAFGLFGGAWFDLRAAGGLFESIGYALPFAPAIEAAKALCGGASISAASGELARAWAWAVLLLVAGLLGLRARTRP